MEYLDDLTHMYAWRKYKFYEFGMEIERFALKDGIHLEVLFEDPFVDSINNRHSYKTVVTNKTLEAADMSLMNFMYLLEQTYDEENECMFDFHEYSSPHRFRMDIYESESGSTLVSIDFFPESYT